MFDLIYLIGLMARDILKLTHSIQNIGCRDEMKIIARPSPASLFIQASASRHRAA